MNSLEKTIQALSARFEVSAEAITNHLNNSAPLPRRKGLNEVCELLAEYQKLTTKHKASDTIRKSGDAVPYFNDLKLLDVEHFNVMYLNRAHKVLAVENLFKGGITGTITDVRVIMKRAIDHKATAMILAHNHPSGALYPSENDKRMTKKIQEACKVLDIELLDHIIMASGGSFSFSDNGEPSIF